MSHLVWEAHFEQLCWIEVCKPIGKGPSGSKYQVSLHMFKGLSVTLQ